MPLRRRFQQHSLLQEAHQRLFLNVQTVRIVDFRDRLAVLRDLLVQFLLGLLLAHATHVGVQHGGMHVAFAANGWRVSKF